MTDIPIIMSAPEVLALLDGRKSMARRLAWRDAILVRPQIVPTIWQRVQPGDRLWCRETAANIALPGYPEVIFYRADDDSRPGHATPPGTKWRPAIHMPRAWSRLTLVVTATRIERLQEISEEDAQAEGVCRTLAFGEGLGARFTFRSGFAHFWDKLHGDDAWAANPEVVCICFRTVQANIDTLASAA